MGSTTGRIGNGRDKSGVGGAALTVVNPTRGGDHVVAFDKGPIFPVGGPKLSSERYIPVSVEDVLNVVIRKPVVRRKEAAGPRVKPLNGALDFGPCGVRESVR